MKEKLKMAAGQKSVLCKSGTSGGPFVTSEVPNDGRLVIFNNFKLKLMMTAVEKGNMCQNIIYGGSIVTRGF